MDYSINSASLHVENTCMDCSYLKLPLFKRNWIFFQLFSFISSFWDLLYILLKMHDSGYFRFPWCLSIRIKNFHILLNYFPHLQSNNIIKLYFLRNQGAEIRDWKELSSNQNNIVTTNVKFKLYTEHRKRALYTLGFYLWISMHINVILWHRCTGTALMQVCDVYPTLSLSPMCQYKGQVIMCNHLNILIKYMIVSPKPKKGLSQQTGNYAIGSGNLYAWARSY